MRIIQGDLFTAEDNVAIGHGVNCRGSMGAGIAVQFKKRYPKMFTEYVKLCKNGELTPGGFYVFFDDAEDRWVYNIASQLEYSGPVRARLEWLAAGVAGALSDVEAKGGKELHLPLIGAGLGGLVREDVLAVLTSVERNRGAEIVLHEL